MTKGFKRDGKFIPTGKRMTNFHHHHENCGCKFTRENREEPFEVIDTRLPTEQELILMQRQPKSYKRRQIGIVTGGLALGTAPVKKFSLQKGIKGITSIGTPDLSYGKKQKLLGGLKGLAKSGKKEEKEQFEYSESAQPQVSAPQISSGGGIVIDPRTGLLHAKSGVLVDGFRLQTLLASKEKNPSVIALALFGAPLVALRPEKQSIIKMVVRRNKR